MRARVSHIYYISRLDMSPIIAKAFGKQSSLSPEGSRGDEDHHDKCQDDECPVWCGLLVPDRLYVGVYVSAWCVHACMLLPRAGE